MFRNVYPCASRPALSLHRNSHRSLHPGGINVCILDRIQSPTFPINASLMGPCCVYESTTVLRFVRGCGTRYWAPKAALPPCLVGASALVPVPFRVPDATAACSLPSEPGVRPRDASG